MKSTYRYLESDRMRAAFTPYIAGPSLILAGAGIVVFSKGWLSGDNSIIGVARWGIPIFIVIAAMCVGLWINDRRVRKFAIVLSDDSICIGDVELTWDQIESIVHRPSNVINWAFRINTRDGRKINILATVESVDDIENFVREKLGGIAAT